VCLAAPLAAQDISYQSKDPVDGLAKQTAFVGLTIWFSGHVDFCGMQGNPIGVAYLVLHPWMQKNGGVNNIMPT